MAALLTRRSLTTCLMAAVLSAVSTVRAGEATTEKFKIFSSKPTLVVVNGYSTSFQWWRFLQRKIDRQFGGKRVIEVIPATRGGTPIAKCTSTRSRWNR